MTCGITLIPGWAASADVFTPLRRKLGAHRTVRIRPWTALIDQDGPLLPADAETPQVLAGWSLGAVLALTEVLRTENLISGLVLIAGTARFCEDATYAGTPVRQVRAMQRTLLRGRHALLTRFFRAAYAPERESLSCEELVQQAETISAEHLDKGLAHLVETDLRHRLSEIAIPVLILHGASDGIIPHAHADLLRRRIPGATLVSFPERGHMLPVTCAGEAARHIERFCNDCLSETEHRTA